MTHVNFRNAETASPNHALMIVTLPPSTMNGTLRRDWYCAIQKGQLQSAWKSTWMMKNIESLLACARHMKLSKQGHYFVTYFKTKKIRSSSSRKTGLVV